MQNSAMRALRFHAYEPLLAFANEPVTPQDWRTRLRDLGAWQLWNLLGGDAEDQSAAPLRINELNATFDRARELQDCLRKELARLALLSFDQSGTIRAEDTAKPPRWRKALVLATGEVFFEDAGEALNYLVEALEYEIRSRETPKGLDAAGLVYHLGTRRSIARGPRHRRRWLSAQLHLQTCECGCKKFFLWEGDWNRKQRRFLSHEHRMNFHNRRNVERKRDLARKRRKDGYYK